MGKSRATTFSEEQLAEIFWRGFVENGKIERTESANQALPLTTE
jgi:hypothetical protein